MRAEGLILLQVALAALLGGIIGAEREYGGKAAGLRTHMLVSAAAALLMNLGFLLAARLPGSVDPSRITQAIVTGISFLGAGTIIFHKKQGFVEGLTTAASVFMVAAIGMTVALEAYFLAVGVTFGAILILVGAGRFEKRYVETRNDQDEESTED